jgi:hypothetical protein
MKDLSKVYIFGTQTVECSEYFIEGLMHKISNNICVVSDETDTVTMHFDEGEKSWYISGNNQNGAIFKTK